MAIYQPCRAFIQVVLDGAHPHINVRLFVCCLLRVELTKKIELLRQRSHVCVFLFHQLSAAAWTHGPFWISRDKKPETTHLPLLSVLCVPSTVTHLPRGCSVLDGYLKAQSLGATTPHQHLSLWAFWLYKAEPAGMHVHVCACHIWYSTPAQFVFLCLTDRQPLKIRWRLQECSLIQWPSCFYESEPSRFGSMTDLTMCWG